MKGLTGLPIPWLSPAGAQKLHCWIGETPVGEESTRGEEGGGEGGEGRDHMSGVTAVLGQGPACGGGTRRWLRAMGRGESRS